MRCDSYVSYSFKWLFLMLCSPNISSIMANNKHKIDGKHLKLWQEIIAQIKTEKRTKRRKKKSANIAVKIYGIAFGIVSKMFLYENGESTKYTRWRFMVHHLMGHFIVVDQTKLSIIFGLLIAPFEVHTDWLAPKIVLLISRWINLLSDTNTHSHRHLPWNLRKCNYLSLKWPKLKSKYSVFHRLRALIIKYFIDASEIYKLSFRWIAQIKTKKKDWKNWTWSTCSIFRSVSLR